MIMQISGENRRARRVMLAIVLVILLAVGAQAGMAAAASGTLTMRMTTTPAGGQDFWVTASSFQGAWGERGIGPGQYRQPRDLDVDAAGNFYVSDHRTSRIQKLDPNGNYLMSIGTRGRGNGQLLRPNAVGVRGNLVYVADTDNHRVVVFTTDGDYVRKWGSLGSGDGQFNYPHGVAFDAAGNVYISDTFNHRIQVFSPTGDYLRQWGTLGSDPGQMRYPAHIDFDAAGLLYVADSNNHRIQVFTSQGVYQRQIGKLGIGPARFSQPVGVDIGADGYLYVSDTYNNRVQKLRTNGTYVGQWSQVAGGADISRPNGLLQVGRLVYVSDIDANRVQIWSQISYLHDDGQQQTESLPAGTYDIVAVPKSGWNFTGATCNAGTPSPISNGVRVTVADGATVECTISMGQ